MMPNKKSKINKTRYLKIVMLLVVLCIIITYISSKKETIYTLKQYDSKGNLSGTNEYIISNGDTIMHGNFVNYNERGVKIAEGKFIDGHVNGVCKYYYNNGKIETQQFKKDKITLESINYDLNGLITNYIMCDNFGRWAFKISFDNKGVTKYEGNPLLEIYQYKYAHKEQFKITEEQHLKVGGKLKYSYIVANIPNAKRSFKIENLGIDNSKIKRTQKPVLPAQIDVEEVLIKKGKNTIRSIVSYKFNDNVTPIFTDTLSFDVNVN